MAMTMLEDRLSAFGTAMMAYGAADKHSPEERRWEGFKEERRGEIIALFAAIETQRDQALAERDEALARLTERERQINRLIRLHNVTYRGRTDDYNARITITFPGDLVPIVPASAPTPHPNAATAECHETGGGV